MIHKHDTLQVDTAEFAFLRQTILYSIIDADSFFPQNSCESSLTFHRNDMGRCRKVKAYAEVLSLIVSGMGEF